MISGSCDQWVMRSVGHVISGGDHVISGSCDQWVMRSVGHVISGGIM